jgi:hypothetical protein
MSNLEHHHASDGGMASQHHASAPHAELKRKRSPSHDTLHSAAAPHPKAAKTHNHNHLQINYLARQLDDDLPLITNDDTLPNILSLLGDYQGVLDRHESMACNLGARPLGPILIKRFERLFDGPPRVLKSHGKDGTTVTWLDVVEFARNKADERGRQSLPVLHQAVPRADLGGRLCAHLVWHSAEDDSTAAHRRGRGEGVGHD